MNFNFLYLDTSGRIGRKAWWLGSAGLLVIAVILNVIAGFIGGMFGLTQSAQGVGLMQLVVMVILFRPVYALALKRLRDRDRPERLFWAFFGPSLVATVFVMFGLSGGIAEVEMFGQKVPAFRPNLLGLFLNLAVIGAGIWAIIELGVRRGRAGARDGGALAPTPPTVYEGGQTTTAQVD